MKSFIITFFLLIAVSASAADLNNSVCTPVDGSRDNTLQFASDGQNVLVMSDFGNHTHPYKIENGTLTVALFGGASVTFAVQDNGSSLKHLTGDFFGDYNCKSNDVGAGQ